MLVACLGDSITEGAQGFSSRSGGDPRWQWCWWASRRHPGAVFRNCGISGQRTDEIRARLDDCARGADVLVVQGGINDIAQGRRIEPAAENVRAMVARGLELGLRVALVDLLPWNNGWPAAEPQIRALNERVAEIALDAAVPLLPFHDTLEDPERPGRMRDEWQSDGDHPSVAGYRRLGELAFRMP